MEVSSGKSELESGVVPRYLTISIGFPVTVHSLLLRNPLVFPIPVILCNFVVADMVLQAAFDNNAVFPEPPDPYRIKGLLLSPIMYTRSCSSSGLNNNWK